MKMNDLPCEIVQDLMPCYIDSLTCDLTNQYIQKHISKCGKCKQIMEEMQYKEKMIEMTKNDAKEVDYLKKFRKKNLFWQVLSLVALIGIIILMTFYVYNANAEIWAYEKIECDVVVLNEKLTIRGELLDEQRKILDINFDESDKGVITIEFKTFISFKPQKEQFENTYIAKDSIKQVKLGNYIIWDHGAKIDRITSDVYHTKHESVGSLDLNSNSWVSLNMVSVLGGVTNEIVMDAEPYGWIMKLNSVKFEDIQYVENKMYSYGYVLLATIDNLGYITYEYMVDGVDKNIVVTKDDATKFMGQNIKLYSGSPAMLQILMEKTGLNRQ